MNSIFLAAESFDFAPRPRGGRARDYQKSRLLFADDGYCLPQLKFSTNALLQV